MLRRGRAGERAPTWTGSIADSAGIRWVQNPPADGLPRWVGRPDLMIGPDPSRPETLFGALPDLAVDGAGRIHALDPTAGRVLVFSPDGSLAGTIGSPGEGPGELGRFAWSLLLHGDTVQVVDWGRGVLQRFLADGTFLEAPRLPIAGGARSWWRASGDGYLVRSLTRYMDDAGRWRGRDALLRVSAGLAVVDTLLRFEYPETDVGAPGDPLAPLVVTAPFWAELADGRVAWSTLAGEEVRIARAPGSLETRITAPDWIRRPVAESDRAILVEGLREKIRGLGGDGAAVDRLPIVMPERYPALTSIVATRDGGFWVQRMGSPDGIHPSALNSPDPPKGFGGSEWDMLDASGRRTGRVRLAPRLRVARVLGDTVYGVQRDELDQERIVRLILERDERG